MIIKSFRIILDCVFTAMSKANLMHRSMFRFIYYALINRARGSYEEIFVLTLQAYGPKTVKSMCLERIYCVPSEINQCKLKLCCVRTLFTVLVRCSVHMPICTFTSQPIRILSLFLSVYSEDKYLLRFRKGSS